MKRELLSCFATITFAALPAIAQQRPPEIGTGSRIRLFVVDTVNASTGELRFTYPAGILAGVDERMIVLRTEAGKGTAAVASDTMSVPLAKVRLAEAYVGTRRHALTGAVGGAAAGAVLGYLIGAIGDHERTGCATIGGSEFCGPTKPKKDTRLVYSISIAALAGLGGALLGHAYATERWTEIDVRRLAR